MGLYAGFSVGVKMNNFLNTFSVGAYANLLLTVIGQVVIYNDPKNQDSLVA